jgi:integrase
LSDRDTIESVARQFIEKYAMLKTRSWKHTAGTLGLKPDKHGRLVRSASGGEVLSAWEGRSAHEITRRDVNALLDGIVSRGAPVKANRTLAAIRKMFSWAASRDIIPASPCVGVSPPTKEVSRDRILTDAELRWIWLACGKLGWPFGPQAQMLILTLQRRDEVTGMRRSEIRDRLWTLPKERVKNSREHQVPLAPAAATLLNSLPVIGRGEYIFTLTGNTPSVGFDGCRQRLDAEILALQKEDAFRSGADPDHVQPLPHWTLHDLRRTGASGMARLGIPLPTIEKVLNHTSGSFGGIVSVYQRHTYADEMRDALEKWAAFVGALVAGPAGENVVRLGGHPPVIAAV